MYVYTLYMYSVRVYLKSVNFLIFVIPNKVCHKFLGQNDNFSWSKVRGLYIHVLVKLWYYDVMVYSCKTKLHIHSYTHT